VTFTSLLYRCGTARRFLGALVLGMASAQTVLANPPRPIFVLNSQDASVSVIDPQTFAERTRIPVGKEPTTFI